MTGEEKSTTGVPTTQTGRRWSYANGTSEVPLLGMTIGDMFDATVEKYPDRPVLIVREQNVRLTYRGLQMMLPSRSASAALVSFTRILRSRLSILIQGKSCRLGPLASYAHGAIA